MTMISKTRTKAVLVLNTLALGGCSAATEHEKTPEELGVHAALQPRLVCDTYESRPGGGKLEEYYVPATINRLLAEHAELREWVGLSNVSTCDEARKFMPQYNSYRDTYPERFPEEAFEPHALTSEAPAGQTGDVRTIEQPIWRGDEVVNYPVVEINSGCTGTIVSERHILTAAHCVPSQNTYAQLYVRWRYGDGTYEGDWFNAFYYPHPNYTGTGDDHDDIALISVRESVHPSPLTGSTYGFWWASNSTSTRMRMWLGNISPGNQLQIYGYGYNSREGTGAGNLREGDGGATITVDWVGTHHFLDVGEARRCHGDSGGPAVLQGDKVAGVASSSEKNNKWKYCAKPDGKQRWTRLSSKMSWIETTMSGAGVACNYFGSGSNLYARCW